MLIMNNNHVTKIDVLRSAASIFAKITWITNTRQYSVIDIAKFDVLGPVSPIFAGITWITNTRQYLVIDVAKIGVLGPVSSIFAGITWIKTVQRTLSKVIAHCLDRISMRIQSEEM